MATVTYPAVIDFSEMLTELQKHTVIMEEYKTLFVEQKVQYETVIENQAKEISLLEAQNAQQAEILQLTAYIFAALCAYGLYRFFSGVLSSIFGGG